MRILRPKKEFKTVKTVNPASNITESPAPDAVVHLELTVPQAQALVSALDVYMRLGLGQIYRVAELVSDGFIPIKATKTKKSDSETEIATVQSVTALCNEIRRELGFSSGESYSVSNVAVSERARRAYEIEKVVKKTLAMHTNVEPAFRDVDYDGLIVRYTDDPAPVCIIS
jgi:hypothetical protein